MIRQGVGTRGGVAGGGVLGLTVRVELHLYFKFALYNQINKITSSRPAYLQNFSPRQSLSAMTGGRSPVCTAYLTFLSRLCFIYPVSVTRGMHYYHLHYYNQLIRWAKAQESSLNSSTTVQSCAVINTIRHSLSPLVIYADSHLGIYNPLWEGARSRA